MSKQIKKKKTSKGLGDIVEIVAKPIAKGIDAIAGTDLEHCPGCERRKSFLNSLSLKLQHFYNGRPHREPTEADIELLVKFYEGDRSEGAKYWQKRLIPMSNRLFYRKDKPTSCTPCWARIEGRLKLIYDEWKEN